MLTYHCFLSQLFPSNSGALGATRCPKRWLDNAAAACHASTHPTHLKRQLNRSREFFWYFGDFYPGLVKIHNTSQIVHDFPSQKEKLEKIKTQFRSFSQAAQISENWSAGQLSVSATMCDHKAQHHRDEHENVMMILSNRCE